MRYSAVGRLLVLIGLCTTDIYPVLAQQSGGSVEEIVVRARRRDELLRDTPVSVTALDSEALRATQVSNLEDVAALVPNLTILSGRSGQDASVVIRGIGAFPFIHFDQGVGIYVDGVFLARQQGSLLDVVDLQQIEVLRGPQGTLFGKNTIGGALNVTTAKPKDELEGSIQVRAGAFDGFEARPIVETRAMLNIPIDLGWFEDRLFTRFAFGTAHDGGYTQNVLLDEFYSDQNSVNFYGSALMRLTDDITVRASGQWTRDHNRGLGGRCVIQQEGGFPFSAFLPEGFFDACRSQDNYRFRSELQAISDNISYGAWGNITWDLGQRLGLDGADIVYTGAWREQTTRSRDDAEMTEFPVFSIRSTGGPGLNGGPNDAQQIQQELQFHGRLDDWSPFGTGLGFGGLFESWKLDFVGGVFSYWETANTNVNLLYLNGNPIIDFPPPRADGSPQGGGTTDNFVDTDNWDYAFFGQAVLDLTDWMSLTGGFRYTREKKGLRRFVRNALMPEDVSVFFDNEEQFEAWTPSATLALKAPDSWLDELEIFDHLMVYATYSKEFRGGGFNGNARTTEEGEAFRPEKAHMYELGAKTTLLDRRLTVNASIYQIDRRDQQVPQLVNQEPDCDLSDPNCLPPPTQVFTRNAATARSRGFEIETLINPIDNLTLNGSIGFSESIFLDFPDAQQALTSEVINRAGQRQAFTPEWQSRLSVAYTLDLDDVGPEWVTGLVTPAVDWTYESDVENFAPEVTQLRQAGYHLFNLRVGYRFNEEKTEVAFWSKNLTDTEYFKNSLSWPTLTGTVVRYYEPPRSLGVELSHRF